MLEAESYMGAAADAAVFRFITVSEEKRPEAVSGIQTVCVVRGCRPKGEKGFRRH
ncbi:TPA: hypothetical protein ACJMD2_000450 [Neisseria meningitidis]